MNCIVPNCKEKVVKENRCRNHFIEYKEIEFCDNTDWENLGICKWLKYMYPEHFRDTFSKDHIKVYIMLLELYDPRYVNKMHRLREVIAYRGFSKSKIIFGIYSYIMMHNNHIIKIKALDGKISEVKVQEKFMVIFSETGGMAEEFVVNIRDEYSVNPMIRYFYSFKIQDAKEEDTGQWTRKAFKINGTFILGLGAGQQARGKIKGAYRPTFVGYDDIYSENNTKTEQTRKNIKRWFYDAAQHSVDDLLGKAFLVGTIVSDDTVIVECEKSNLWRTLKFYPMPELKFQEFIKEHLNINLDFNTCALPFEDEDNEFKRIEKQISHFKKIENLKDWELSWKDRMGLYQLALKYKEAVENRAIGGFYQEYFHVTIPDELRKFYDKYFRPMGEWSISNEFGYNWLECPSLYKEKIMVNIEIGVDLASGLKEGDDVAISIVASAPDGRFFVLDTVYGKFAIRDNIHGLEDSRMDRIVLDRKYITKIGYIDELFRLTKIYKPRVIKIGTGGGLESSIVTEVERLFRANWDYTTILPRPQTSRDGKKEERIEETILPKYESMSVFHREGLLKLEYQLKSLGKASDDDLADSLEVAFFNIYRPFGVDYKIFNSTKEIKKPKWGYQKDTSENWLEDWRTN